MLALGLWPSATEAAHPPVRGSVVLAFVPTGEPGLQSVPGTSVGIMSATQGLYSATQLLLDITQGARVTATAYSSEHPPELALRTLGAEGRVVGWRAALRRAESAPQLLRPGLLAAQLPGGAAYAGIAGAEDTDAIAAADRGGRVTAVSLGTAPSLLARIAALRRAHSLVVADLPAGRAGREDLRALALGRAPGELLLVVQRARTAPGHELLWVAAAGLADKASAEHPPADAGTGGGDAGRGRGGDRDGGNASAGRSARTGGGGGELTSQTTEQRGLIAAVDIAPTILHRLGLAVPADMRGFPIRTDGPLRSAYLRALMARLHVIGPRRLRALGWLLIAWLVLLLACTRWPRARAWAMRAGALGVLWAPVAALIPAALEPSAAVEYVTIALSCLALGALTDRLLSWPRALLAPAIVAVIALAADALAGTQLLMRSLLGPDPILGARFYGIGNELKSGLAVLVFAAVAAAVYPCATDRSSSDLQSDTYGSRRWTRTAGTRRAALVMAGAGIVLAAVEGSARIGAGVGGVILVSAGTAVATVMLLGGALTRRRALIVLVAPVAGLVLLAALDLATAHGAGHFTGSVLDARSPGDIRDLIVRRYAAAWDELRNEAMPVATAVALLAAALGLYRRERLLAPVANDPAWLATLCGGLAAGTVGALVEDSGPVLLVVAVFALGCVLTYLWGRPDLGNRAREALISPHRGRDSRREPS